MNRFDWTEVWYWVGRNGVKRGLALISLVTLWDIGMFGWRHFFQYSIGWRGILIIWIGVALIAKGYRIEKNG